MRCICLATVLAAFAAVPLANAGNLIYTPINPSFGGSPFNSAHLTGLANTQNEHKPSSSNPLATQSASARFAQQLQSQLYAGLAQKVSEAIFGKNAQNQGTYSFGDQKISFVNDGSQVTLTILNTTTGESTEISVPSTAVATP